MKKCNYCDTTLAEGVNFCSSCFKQVVCLNCKEVLSPNAPRCLFCGDFLVDNNKSTIQMNKFEYDENEHGRHIRALFSDVVANSVGQTFFNVLPFKLQNNNPINKIELPSQNTETFASTSLSEEKNTDQTTSLGENKNQNSQAEEKLNKIFIVRDENISLHETRLKADSQLNYGIRTVLLFLYYNLEIKQKDEVQRSEITDLLGKYDLNTGGYRHWFANKSANYINNNNGSLSLTQEGIEQAEAFLKDVFNSNIPNNWELGKTTKKTSSSPEKNSNSSSSKTSSKSGDSYKRVLDLNLKPTDKESLKDFYSKYQAKGTPENILLIVHYLQNIHNSSAIGINQIYTCFLELGLRVPNLISAVMNTKTRRGWLITSDMNNIKLSIHGDNYLLHDIKKN